MCNSEELTRNRMEYIWNSKLVRNTIIISLITVITLVFLFYLIYHLRVIRADYQFEFREGAMLLTTHQLLNKINPFSLSEQPQHTQNYGVLFSVAAYPLASKLGVTLTAHRLTVAIFIFFSCFLIFYILRRERVPVYLSAAASVIFYVQLCSLFTLFSRPDSLGLFIFLLSVFIPWWRKFDTPSLLLSILLAFLALLTKIYFVFGLPLVIAYLFIFKSKKRGILLSVGAAIFFIPLIYFINRYFESYFTNTFYFFLDIATGSWAGIVHLFKQIIVFSYKNFSLVLILFILLLNKRFFATEQIKNFFTKLFKSVRLKNWQKPLLTDINFNFISFCLLCSILVFVFIVGRNVGSFVDYIHHLISPFLLIVLFKYLNVIKQRPIGILCFGLVLLNLIFYIFIQNTFVDYSQSWKNLENRMNKYNNILNGPSLVSILIKQNKPVYDTGHSFILTPKPPSLASQKVKDRINVFNEEIKKSIINKEFDAIMIENNEVIAWTDLIDKNYNKVINLPVFYTFYNSGVIVWEPKK